MKLSLSSLQHRLQRGYSAFLMVGVIALSLLALLALNLKGTINTTDAQRRAQIRQDYVQKEKSIIRALLHIVPETAKATMQPKSTKSAYTTWESVFERAIETANAEQSISDRIIGALDLQDKISANSGELSESDLSMVKPYDGDTSGGFFVNSGNWRDLDIYDKTSGIRDQLPAPLGLDEQQAKDDRQYVIVGPHKQYPPGNHVTQEALYQGKLGASTDDFPEYNLLKYPNIKLGYKRPGDPFVAKRNWWTFSLTFGEKDAEKTKVPPVTRNYMISIYEFPTQLPLTSNANLKVGRFGDGSDWENVNIEGSLYGEGIETQGIVSITEGAMTAGRTLNLSDSTYIDGDRVNEDSLEVDAREELIADNNGDSFINISRGGDAGGAVIIPHNPGNLFLRRFYNSGLNRVVAPIKYNVYVTGGSQCKMIFRVLGFEEGTKNVPLSATFSYAGADGTRKSLTITRGKDSWPAENEPGGDLIPFQLETLDNGRNVITVNMKRFEPYLASLGNAAPLSVNHSLLIEPPNSREQDPNDSEAVLAPEFIPTFPSPGDELAISLRECEDLTNFPKGFSLVSAYRLYISDSFNIVAHPEPPAGSGLPSGTEYFPPASLFAPEKRFGDDVLVNNPVAIKGQVNSLKNGLDEDFNPLDVKNAGDNNITAEQVSADLMDIKSPAQVPPIHLRNWLVTIEPLRN